MATITLVDSLVELQDPATPLPIQIARLKHLRNEVIGHATNKTALVQQGLLEALLASLTNATRARGKQRSQVTNGTSSGAPNKPIAWSDQDEVCLHALIVLGSLATGQHEHADLRC